MIYLSVENLSKQFPDNLLFKGLKFSLQKGDKVGLIANNGTGKSSLMKVLAGKEVADEGLVHIRNGISSGYLEQDPEFNDDQSILELIESSHTEIQAVINAYENAVNMQAENFNDVNIKAFEQATARMDQLNAWDYERRLKEIFDRFNIFNLNQKIGSMSGGEKKRLAMALVLLDSPDLLILDEPTNHLDVEMIEWLEKYLLQSKVTLLMVTHDRYFLDRICNHIMELQDGKMYHHDGNYTYFLEKRAERETIFKTEVDKAGKLMKKELEWIRRSPKARTTKAKSRINAFDEIKEKASRKPGTSELRLEVKMARIGGKIMELKHVAKQFGDTVILKNFTHTFKKGERIGIVGKNGIGKSTFLNLLIGAEPADSGKINPGETTVFGYYSQKGLVLKKDQRIIDVLKDIAEVITLGDGNKLTASQFLQHFLFPKKMQRTYYSRLSGGEKRRLYLLTVLIRNPNFLILDEPTNDLDLLTLNKLEEFLENFQGCLILVSHDRYFMDKLVDQLFVFEGGGNIRGFVGTYREYRDSRELEEKKEKLRQFSEKQNKQEPVKTAVSIEKKKLTFKEKLEYESLENAIHKLEKEKVDLEENLTAAIDDYQLLEQTTQQLSKVIADIDKMTGRWMELDELV